MLRRPFLILLPALWLSACSAAPVPAYLARPADPRAPVPALGYRSVTAGTDTLRPSEPKDWREMNRRVGPQP